jgi:hypothetical protein
MNNKEHIMKKLGFKENQDQTNKIDNETINIEDKSKENETIVKTEESHSKELDNIKFIKLNKEDIEDNREEVIATKEEESNSKESIVIVSSLLVLLLFIVKILYNTLFVI